ncbi:MAG TPA: hypothetical protein VJO53_10270 [Candidatus Acidoferrales bacterium]|nr:hypothetical protein [Candidatus Acidoferrales bacterium]
MKIPILGTVVDERFLNHRLRSTSLGGIAGCLVAVALFEYRFFVNHIWSWDLFSVAVTIVAVKLAVMAWFLFTD